MNADCAFVLFKFYESTKIYCKNYRFINLHFLCFCKIKLMIKETIQNRIL